MLKNSMNVALLLLLQLLLITIAVHYSAADESFDVRQHLSTVSRYGIVKDMSYDSFVPSENLDQCTPIHLNLVARHGTRASYKEKDKGARSLCCSIGSPCT